MRFIILCFFCCCLMFADNCDNNYREYDFLLEDYNKAVNWNDSALQAVVSRNLYRYCLKIKNTCDIEPIECIFVFKAFLNEL